MKIKSTESKICALVLGSGLNGYSVIRELYDRRVPNIVLLQNKKDYAYHSNKISRRILVETGVENLEKAIHELHMRYEFIITYPVDDEYVYYLYELRNTIEDFCFIPFNPENVRTMFGKSGQYLACEKNDIPYPKTKSLKEYLNNETGLVYPLLIKPDVWGEQNSNIRLFKTMTVDSPQELADALPILNPILDAGINLLITELIPGNDDAIYGYVAYRSRNGDICNEWACRKLSQHPEGRGVFATVSNRASDELFSIGRDVFRKFDLLGINEIEFKYDVRDGKFKYIETNYRGPMFHRLGTLTGVDLYYTQYLDSTSQEIIKQSQNRDTNIHFMYFKNEIFNMMSRLGYITKLKSNLTDSDKTYFAVFNWKDPLPMIYDWLSVFFEGCRRVFKKIHS